MTPHHGASKPFHWLASRATDRPIRTVVIAMVVFVAALLSALTLRPGTAVQDMLGQQAPSAIAFSRLIEHFSLIDDLSLFVELPDKASEDRQADLLAFAQRFADIMKRHDEVVEVSWTRRGDVQPFVQQVVLPNLPWYLSEAQRAQLADRLTPEAMRAQMRRNAALLTQPGAGGPALRELLAQDPLRLRDLLLTPETARKAESLSTDPVMFSSDRKALLIRVAGTRPANDLPFTHRFVSLANQAVSDAQPGDLRVGITGAYAIADFTARSTRNDMILSMIGSLALLSALFLVVYRSWHAWPVTMLTLNTAIITAFGIYAAVGGQLTPVTAVTGAVLAGLGIDYCIHTLAHTRAHRQAGIASRDAVVRAVAEAGPSMTAACFTSAAGFAAVALSDVRSLREFALLGVLGLGLSLFAAVTLFPALLVLIYRKHDRTTQDTTPPPRLRAEALVQAIATRPRPWLACSLVCIVAMLLLVASQARSPVFFSDDLESLHPVPNAPLNVQRHVAQRMGISPGVMMVHVTGDNPDALLKTCREVQHRLRQLAIERGEIGEVIGPADLLPPTDRPAPDWDVLNASAALQHFDEAVAQSPFDPALFTRFRASLQTMLTPSERPHWATLAAVPESAGALLPRGALLPDANATILGPTEALVILRPAIPWEELEDRGATVAALRDSLSGLPATLTGLAIIGLDTQTTIAQTLLSALAVATGVIFICVALYFRTLSDALLACMPAGVGLLALAALLATTHHELNAVNLIALPLTLGLGVDDGIFLVAVSQRLRRGENVAKLWATSAHAIVMTTLTTLLAFGSLAFTSSPAIESLGVLSAVGVGACLAASLAMLLPILTMRHNARLPEGDPNPAVSP